MIALATIAVVPGAARAQRLLLPGAAPPGARPALGDVIQRAERSVVLITVQTRRGEDLGFGSGFLVDPRGLVATNHHVVRRAGKAFVQFKDGRKVAVKGIRAQDEKADLAIVELEAMPGPVPALPLGPRRPPRPGDAVVAIGHPHGLRFSASAGIVSAVRESSDLSECKVATEDERRWIQTTAMVAGGSSGGPLMSEAGQVLGVIAFNLPDQGISFAAHVGHLTELLDSSRGRPNRELPGEPLADDVENPLEELSPRVAKMYAEYRSALEEFGRQLEEAIRR
jgi:S1-C subfamily serine protease